MFRLAFNLISVPLVIKNFLRFNFVVAFMLVHCFICLSARVEFKFKFEFKWFEFGLKKKRG